MRKLARDDHTYGYFSWIGRQAYRSNLFQTEQQVARSDDDDFETSRFRQGLERFDYLVSTYRLLTMSRNRKTWNSLLLVQVWLLLA